MVETGSIFVERDGHIATVVLNRPERLNALDLSAWQRLAEAFAGLNADTTVRCIVVRGAGDKAFSAGADISAFEHERRNVDQAVVYGEAVAAAMGSIISSPHPTLALIEGACVGGGLEVACACDLRICDASSRFGIPVNRLGLTMAHDELRALLAVVPPPVAKEILFSGEIFSAESAARMGLVNRIAGDDVTAETYSLAAGIAAGAPLTNRWHKQFIHRLADPTPLAADEIAEGYAAFATTDFERGYRAFLNKTDPEFEGN